MPEHDITSVDEIATGFYSDGVRYVVNCKCGSSFHSPTEEEARRRHAVHHAAATGLPEIAALRETLRKEK